MVENQILMDLGTVMMTSMATYMEASMGLVVLRIRSYWHEHIVCCSTVQSTVPTL